MGSANVLAYIALILWVPVSVVVLSRVRPSLVCKVIGSPSTRCGGSVSGGAVVAAVVAGSSWVVVVAVVGGVVVVDVSATSLEQATAIVEMAMAPTNRRVKCTDYSFRRSPRAGGLAAGRGAEL